MSTKFKKKINGRVIGFIFVFWTFYVVAYALCAYINLGGAPLKKYLFESAYQHIWMAFISIGLWFLCKRMPFGRFSFWLFLLIHSLFACLATIVWSTIVLGSAYLAFGDDIYYAVPNFPRSIAWQLLFGIILYFIITVSYYAIMYYQNFRKKELAETRLKLLSRDAELRALKLQLNPHFLFNSLNSINAMVTANPKQARKMIARLSDLLRMALESHDQQTVPLQYELDFTHAYLDIEKIRFEDKMDYQEQVDPELLTKTVPAMMLQPLLENAVKHGITNRLDGGTVRLTIASSTEHVIVEVRNPLHSKQFIDSKMLDGNGTGLNNLKERLYQLYGENYQLDIDADYGKEFKICLQLPNMTEAWKHAD